jgi:hypothetical protein
MDNYLKIYKNNHMNKSPLHVHTLLCMFYSNRALLNFSVFYLELYKNKFKNLFRVSKFKFFISKTDIQSSIIIFPFKEDIRSCEKKNPSKNT